MQQVLEPLFDPFFLDCSYGCRLHVGVPHALAQVSLAAERGLRWIVDGDIANYFHCIDHTILPRFVRQRITEEPILQLLEQWLDADMLDVSAGAESMSAHDPWWS